VNACNLVFVFYSKCASITDSEIYPHIGRRSLSLVFGAPVRAKAVRFKQHSLLLNRERDRISMIRSAVLIYTIHACDRQTDGRSCRSIYALQHTIARKNSGPDVTLQELAMAEQVARPRPSLSTLAMSWVAVGPPLLFQATHTHISIGARSTLGARHFCPKDMYEIFLMPEFYVIFDQKISKIPEFL